MKYSIRIIKGPAPFPDYRQVADMLWGCDVDYDSDGNCEYPADRNWTELCIRQRHSDNGTVSIYLDNGVFIIESNNEVSAKSVGLFLIEWSGGEWHSDIMGKEIRNELIDKHNFLEKWQRAEASVWKTATQSNPYPNKKFPQQDDAPERFAPGDL